MTTTGISPETLALLKTLPRCDMEAALIAACAMLGFVHGTKTDVEIAGVVRMVRGDDD